MASWIVHLRISKNLHGVFLTAQPELVGLDFLIPEGVRWSVEHIQQYFHRTDEEIQELYNHPYTYLSCERADRFVVESTRQLSRIYEHLWINGMAADGVESAMDLNI